MTKSSAADAAPKRTPVLELVCTALIREGLSTSGSTDDKIDRLRAHYETSNPSDTLIDCSECGYATPDTEPACAFCGHDDAVTPAGGPLTPLPAPARKGETSELVMPVAELAALGDLVEAEKRLDAAVSRYASANREMIGAGWDMGDAVREIHESRLYLARRGPGGQPVHRSFADFCKAELRTSATHVLRMIDVAAKFTREQALEIGTTKLSLTLRVDDEEKRAPLLAAAADPAVSVRQLGEMTREAVREQAPRDVDRRGKKHAGGRPAKSAAPAKQPSDPTRPPPPVFPPVDPQPEKDEKKPRRRLTLSVEEGEFELHFYARRKHAGDKRRARELSDGPIARIKFANGTQMRIRLFRGDKGLFGKGEFTEVDDGEGADE